MKKVTVFKLFFKQLWNMDKKYIIVSLFQRVASAFRTLLFLYIPKLLIDLIVRKSDLSEMVRTLIVILAISFFAYLFESYTAKIVDIEGSRINVLFSELFAEKMMKLEYSYLEDTKYLDMKEQAEMAMSIMGAPKQMAEEAGVLLEIIITLISIGTMLIRLNPYLLLIIIVVELLSVLVFFRIQAVMKVTMDNLVPINRKYGYLVNNLFDVKTQKDIRIYDMSDLLIDNIYDYNKKMMEEFIVMQKKEGFYSWIISIINYVISVITIIYAGLRTMTTSFGSKISIGDFTLYTGMAAQFSLQLEKLLTNLSYLLLDIHYLIPFQVMMMLPEEKNIGYIKLEGEIEKIEFRNVSFKYPNTEKLILNNLSFEINKNERISIVGLNGAGKTTLVKLICRFFRPDTGEILINGINIFDYENESYMKQVSAVFQDFKIFNLTIRDNIEAGYADSDFTRIDKLLDEVDLKEKIEELPHGIDTYIGKSYSEDGVDMSGGQMQKLAIVRALNKDSSLVILDEPTSALDPVSEAEIYEHFNSLSKDNTVIFISHRMSSSVFCDKILLINNGKIEDFDSHNNLMKKTNSLYYKMFKAQSDNYKLS